MILIDKVFDILDGEHALEWVVNNKDVNVYFDKYSKHHEPMFHVVCRYGKIDIARELIRLGVDVNVRDSHGYGTIHNIYPNPKVVDLLLEQPTFDVNHKGGVDGVTPLHEAIYLSNRKRVPYALKLLKAGARTDIKNTYGYVPFQDDDTLNDVRRKVQALLALCRLEGLSNDIVRCLKNYL